jgi:hexosaminidase
VKEYAREDARKYTSFTPLNRLVDATRPESDTAREFAKLVGDWKTNEAEIRSELTRWRDVISELPPLMERSALLQEDVALTEDVSGLAAIGLRALDYLDAGKRAPASWIADQSVVLDRAARPRAELLIVIVPSIRKLVDAAKRGQP